MPLRMQRPAIVGCPPRSRKFRAAKVRNSAKSITTRGESGVSRVLSLSFGKIFPGDYQFTAHVDLAKPPPSPHPLASRTAVI